jgi:polyhydroxyalkanoate synthesis regulator phasin
LQKMKESIEEEMQSVISDHEKQKRTMNFEIASLKEIITELEKQNLNLEMAFR